MSKLSNQRNFMHTQISDFAVHSS